MQMSVAVFISLKHFPSEASSSIASCTKTAARTSYVTAIKAGGGGEVDNLNISIKRQSNVIY
jgi:hypothetical protein